MEIKSSHVPIKGYYSALAEFEKHGITKETSVRAAFQELLSTYGRKMRWSFDPERPITLANKNKGSVDGALLDAYGIVMGYWEAKDSNDDLGKEIKKKFEIGYPKSNIIFQEPKKAVLYQDGVIAGEYDLTDPERLATCLRDFFHYHVEEQTNWTEIADSFKERIPESARQLVAMIEEEKRSNKRFQAAFQTFADLCRSSINPNLSDAAIEEMLVQHLLTSRLFSSVFNNPEFVRRNVIAAEIEKVVDALTSRNFNRDDFFRPLDHFYKALENRAKTITDWSEKQHFINTVYERFFQGFSVKIADTHGIVYTPQPIVDFMVRSVQHILKTEFGRSLADEGVHILDPFVGTGNFILRVIREIAETQKTKLPKKYASELHCNEVMLLPYYIASMNIEHEYYSHTKDYKPFEGICLVDTFELAEGRGQRTAFVDENQKRIERQKDSPLVVIIGNPPYNAGQVNENDNNKNRKYPAIDESVANTYGKDSAATNKNALSDPYVKAYRFGTNKILREGGVLAFVSNSSFLRDLAFDGMRKHLYEIYDEIYIYDLGGNVRKNPKLSGTVHNVFGIQVGVCIALLVRKVAQTQKKNAKIFYARFDEMANKQTKLRGLTAVESVAFVQWQELQLTSGKNWLELGDSLIFDQLTPLRNPYKSTGDSPSSIFLDNSYGVQTNRDSWVTNFHKDSLEANVKSSIEVFNLEVERWKKAKLPESELDNFIQYDDHLLKWSSRLKELLLDKKPTQFDGAKVVLSLFRPFTKKWLYFDSTMVHRRMGIESYFPNATAYNRVLLTSGIGSNKSVQCFVSDAIPYGDTLEKTQCFPLYVYDTKLNRRSNISHWAMARCRALTGGEVNPEDIFNYTYAILQHPAYREKYAQNLRRELPRIPLPTTTEDFWKLSEAGKKLADLHVNYEQQKEYPLTEEWSKGSGLNLRVEKMKLTKDKTAIIYNPELTLRGIPPEAFEYRLGNRSAIDWIIDQYQVSTDKRSGITNDPNRPDDDQYILRLIKQVVTVSLETVEIVRGIGEINLQAT